MMRGIIRTLGRRLLMPTAVVSLTLGGTTPLLAQEPPRNDRVRMAELSPETERAIDRGLEYLVRQQRDDGSFSGRHQSAITGVTLMAFMLKGYFPEHGPYHQQLDKAVEFLVRQSLDGGGYVGGSMYEQGLTTLALAEVWGMSSRDDVREALKRNVEVILRAQHPNGGWRYSPTPVDHDSSVTVMVLIALLSAQEAGIMVPREPIDRAIQYILSCQNPSGGFSYTPPNRDDRFARSAACTMALFITGQGYTTAAQRGLAYLERQPEEIFRNTDFYFYGHYYAIQAMYQAGERHYQNWYPKIRDGLLSRQQRDGRWNGGRGGDEYSTAMAILVLGVPYRYLPIYQR